MCKNIKVLFNYDPPATPEEVRAAAAQYVRKVSGFNQPSQANIEAFDLAIDEIMAACQRLLDTLTTNAAVKNRARETAKAQAKSKLRFRTKSNITKS